MILDTTDGRQNTRVSAGQPNTLSLVVENTGTAPITERRDDRHPARAGP